jgi:hypothetical protein
MFKVAVVIFALACTVLAAPGGWTDQTSITDDISNIAKWSMSQLSAYTGVEGEHNLMQISNVQTQVVSGINYKMTVDVLIQSSDNSYTFRQCDLVIYDQPWTNTRYFLEEPVCRAHPNFPKF